MQGSFEEVRCPITDKLTTSCQQCSLFKSPPIRGVIKCGAKKGQRYHMSARPATGDFWDTYVLTVKEIKEVGASQGIGFVTVRAKKSGD